MKQKTKLSFYKLGLFLMLTVIFIPHTMAFNNNQEGSKEEQLLNDVVSQRKMQTIYDFMNSKQSTVTPLGGGGYRWLRNPYNVYKQDYWYYCGPASVQQVINYITGDLRNQSIYAKDLQTKSDGSGSYVYLVKNTLNKYQNQYDYSYKLVSDKDMNEYILFNGIMNTIANNKPVILHARGEALYMYNGHKNGHYITVTGVYEDYLDVQYAKFTYADTNESNWGRGNTFGIFEDDFITMYNSLRSNNRYVIW